MFSVSITHNSKIRELSDENNHPKPSQTIIHLWDPIWHHHSTCHHSNFSTVCGPYICNLVQLLLFYFLFFSNPQYPNSPKPMKKKKKNETKTKPVKGKRKKKKKKPPSMKGKRKKRRWRNQTHWTGEKKKGQKLRLTLTVGPSM